MSDEVEWQWNYDTNTVMVRYQGEEFRFSQEFLEDLPLSLHYVHGKPAQMRECLLYAIGVQKGEITFSTQTYTHSPPVFYGKSVLDQLVEETTKIMGKHYDLLITDELVKDDMSDALAYQMQMYNTYHKTAVFGKLDEYYAQQAESSDPKDFIGQRTRQATPGHFHVIELDGSFYPSIP